MKCPMTFTTRSTAPGTIASDGNALGGLRSTRAQTATDSQLSGVAFIAANGMRVASINGGESPDEYGEECDVDEVFGRSGAK